MDSFVCPTGQGVSLYIPQPAINATVQDDILLSVDYSCHGVPTIEWKYTSNWGVQKIVEWKAGTPANVSQSHRDRVCTFDNGSIQLFSVGVRDSGYYVITVTERPGSSQSGTIVLHVSGKRDACTTCTGRGGGNSSIKRGLAFPPVPLPQRSATKTSTLLLSSLLCSLLWLWC